jgi:hypothetical protein
MSLWHCDGYNMCPREQIEDELNLSLYCHTYLVAKQLVLYIKKERKHGYRSGQSLISGCIAGTLNSFLL